MEGVEKCLTRERRFGEITRIAEIRGQVIAAPKPRSVAGQRVGPTLDEEARIGFVAEFAAGRGADVVAHAAAERHEVAVARGGSPEAEIDVFAAVDVRRVKPAEFFPECAPQHDARAGDGNDAAVTRLEEWPTRAAWQKTDVLRFAFEVNADAGVIDEARGGVDLDVAYETRARAVSAVRGEHRLKPLGCEDQVVVEQGQKFAPREGGAGVIGGGEAGVFLVQDDADDGIGGEGGEPRAGAIGAAVVDENDLVL